MLFVTVNWIYLAFTTFLLGTAFAKFVKRALGWEIKCTTEIVFYGVICATLYAQVFSLFCGVGALANGILLAVCIVTAFAFRETIKNTIVRSVKESGQGYCLIAAALILVWAYCTSRGYMHYDSDLYHAQSIRWIEEYGVVPGLGNLHIRFSYNSSFFALSALYSMKFLGGQSLHTVNGFFALILSLEVLKMFRSCRFRKENGGRLFRLSDFARLGALYYLTVLYGIVVAPASDYVVMCAVFLIVIRWLSHLEQKEHLAAPYALLCVAGVYAVTLKLTAGCILFLVLKPAWMLLKEKRGKEIAVCLLMGVLVLAPWVIRTALISGYLIYPFPTLDILNVDWKIPPGAVAHDAAEIKTWGRGLNNATLVDMPFTEWFPHWFSTMLPPLGKLFVTADLVCTAVWTGLLAAAVLRLRKKEGMQEEWDALLVLTAVVLSYGFWQLSAPLLRYGYAYVLLVIVLTAGVLYQKWRIPAAADQVFCVLVFLFLAVKALTFVRYTWSVSAEPYYVVQQDYGNYELDSFEENDVCFYYPKSGDRVGYEPFPAIPAKTGFVFRGKRIQDGFRRPFSSNHGE